VLLGLAACQTTPNLSETQELLTTVLPQTTDFGPLEVGMTSPARGFTISPTGYSSQTVNAVNYNCPDFTVNAVGLPASVYRVCIGSGGPLPAKAGSTESSAACQETEQENYFFSATFHPSVGGATSCVVSIDISSGAKSITLYGTGTIPPVDISVSPGLVVFGDVRRNTSSSPAQIMVRNNGGQSMSVSSATVTAGFAITSGPASTTVAAGGQQPYNVICQPTGLGAMSGMFRVVSNDPDNGTVNIPLSCRGIDSNLDISPSPAQIPITRVGEPEMSTIQLINSGAASMTITSVTLESTGIELVSAPTGGTVLAGNGGSAPATVTFGATTPTTATGTLTVVYDGGETRTSQISAQALATSMALTPDGDVDLGPICLGQMKAQPFTVLANAEASFQILGVSNPEPPFTLVAPAFPAGVKGSGGTASFEVRALPTAVGVLRSTIDVATDIPGSATRTINLSAIALGEGVTGTPDVLDLGQHPIDMTTIGQEIAVANCTTSTANLANPRIEGLDAASFAIVQQPTTSALAANGVAKWLVVFAPRTVGDKMATFSVDYEGGTTSVTLIGEGIGALVGGGPKGYYACSAAGASALWPIGLALLMLRRRRRR
jgi:uncharacterized protein (TIGR03382 family)